MTESEWMASKYPAAMLRLGDRQLSVFNFSNRKLRLLACAYCRACWHLFTDKGSRRAVEVAEQYADGEVTEQERHHAWDAAIKTYGLDLFAAARCADDDGHIHSAPAIVSVTVKDWVPFATQADLLREIVGNPFRPMKLQDGRLYVGRNQEDGTWNVSSADWLTPTGLSLAQAAYDERPGGKCKACGGSGCDGRSGMDRCGPCYGTGTIDDGTLDPVRLAILADAMEEAGCDNEVMLTHLRSPGPHYRGCWVIDTVLGRE